MMARIMYGVVVLLILVGAAIPAQAQDDPPPVQAFVSQDGSLSFEYPGTWKVIEYDRGEQYYPVYLRLEIVDQGYPQLFYGQAEVLHAPNTVFPRKPPPWLHDSAAGVLNFFTFDSSLPYGEVQPLPGDHTGGTVCLPDEVAMLPVNCLTAVALGEGDYLVFDLLFPGTGGWAAFEESLAALLASLRWQPDRSIALELPLPTAGDSPDTWTLPATKTLFTAVAAGPDDTLYVNSQLADPVLRFLSGGVILLDAGGRVQSAFVHPILAIRADVDMMADGTLWVTDFFGCTLYHLTPDGALLDQRRFDGSDCAVQQLEFDSDGNFYTLHTPRDGGGLDATVHVTSPDGEPLRTFTVSEPDVFMFDNEFGNAAGFSIGPDDRLYIVAAGMFGSDSFMVRVYDRDGALLSSSFAPDLAAAGIRVRNVYAAPDGMVYLLGQDDVLYRYAADGTPQGSLALPFEVTGFTSVQPVTQLSNGDLVVISLDDAARVRFPA